MAAPFLLLPRNSVTWPVSQQALRQAGRYYFKSVRQGRQVSELDKADEDFQRI